MFASKELDSLIPLIQANVLVLLAEYNIALCAWRRSLLFTVSIMVYKCFLALPAGAGMAFIRLLASQHKGKKCKEKGIRLPCSMEPPLQRGDIKEMMIMLSLLHQGVRTSTCTCCGGAETAGKSLRPWRPLMTFSLPRMCKLAPRGQFHNKLCSLHHRRMHPPSPPPLPLPIQVWFSFPSPEPEPPEPPVTTTWSRPKRGSFDLIRKTTSAEAEADVRRGLVCLSSRVACQV